MVGEEKYGRFSPRQLLRIALIYASLTFAVWCFFSGAWILVGFIFLVKFMEPLADALRRAGGYEPLVRENSALDEIAPFWFRLTAPGIGVFFGLLWIGVTFLGAWLFDELLPYAAIQALPAAAIIGGVLLLIGPWLLALFAEFVLGFALSLADVFTALLAPRPWRLALHGAIDRLDHWIVDLYFKKQAGIAARSDLSEYAREQAGLNEAAA